MATSVYCNAAVWGCLFAGRGPCGAGGISVSAGRPRPIQSQPGVYPAGRAGDRHENAAAPTPAITAIQSVDITGTSARITWTTDLASDSQVEYGTTISYGQSTSIDPTPTTAHSVTVSGLSESTTYHYRVKSKAAGEPGVSGDNTFRTPGAPAISNVTASGITLSGATITWNTNIASDSQVEYGTTTSYGQSTALDPTLTTSHTAALGGLSPGVTYHYRVKSRSSVGFGCRQ